MKNTYRNRSFLSEIQGDAPIPVATLAYFRQRLRNHLHELVLGEFLKQEADTNLTKAKIARRMRRENPSQITRWFSSPSNLSIDTMSDLMLAMGAAHEWLDSSAIAWVEKNQPLSGQTLVPQNHAQAAAAGLLVKGKAENENNSISREPSDPALQTLARVTPR
jgi:hypothetical protein